MNQSLNFQLFLAGYPMLPFSHLRSSRRQRTLTDSSGLQTNQSQRSTAIQFVRHYQLALHYSSDCYSIDFGLPSLLRWLHLGWGKPMTDFLQSLKLMPKNYGGVPDSSKSSWVTFIRQKEHQFRIHHQKGRCLVSHVPQAVQKSAKWLNDH